MKLTVTVWGLRQLIEHCISSIWRGWKIKKIRRKTEYEIEIEK